jgi:hypothetical protein
MRSEKEMEPMVFKQEDIKAAHDEFEKKSIIR